MPNETRKLIGTGIKSVYLGTRDEGFEHESNDCFVKALQAVTGVPYRDAHEFCRTQMGRKDRKGTSCMAPMMQIERERETVYGFRVFRHATGVEHPARYSWMRQTAIRYDTLTQFVRTHKTGKFLVWSNRHAWAVIDGVVYDNGAAGARTQVTTVYEFIESSKCEGR